MEKDCINNILLLDTYDIIYKLIDLLQQIISEIEKETVDVPKLKMILDTKYTTKDCVKIPIIKQNDKTDYKISFMLLEKTITNFILCKIDNIKINDNTITICDTEYYYHQKEQIISNIKNNITLAQNAINILNAISNKDCIISVH